MEDNKLINRASVFVVLFAFVGIIIVSVVGVWSNMVNNPFKNSKSNIIISFRTDLPTKGDSVYLFYSEKVSLVQLKEVLGKLESQSGNVSELLDRRDKIDYQNSIFFKLLGGLGAILFSVIGFFGYKSIHQIKDSSEKEARGIASEVATNEATKVAKEVADKTAERIAKEQVSDSLSRMMETNKNIYEEKLDELTEKVSSIEDNLSLYEIGSEITGGTVKGKSRSSKGKGRANSTGVVEKKLDRGTDDGTIFGKKNAEK